jgi:hypothetical protein
VGPPRHGGCIGRLLRPDAAMSQSGD